jgi:M6 family metalloprotease-like protein
MKKLAQVLSFSLSLTLLTSPSFAAVKAGSACSKAGSKSVSGGKSYTCIKSGKKLVWDKGVLVPVAKPAPSASASAAPGVVEIADPTLSSKTVFADAQTCQLKSTLTHEANLGYGIDSSYVKSTGNVNLAIIYTTYTDAPGDDRAFDEYGKVQFPNIAKFYSTASFGRMTISLTTTNKYYNINKTSESYNLMALNETSRFAEVAADAVNAAKNDYDFSKIDAILVVMPSSSKAVDLGAMGTQINVGGKTFYQGITAAFINPSTKEKVRPLFLTHEIGHNFGLPHPLPQDKGYGWDVMLWEQVPAPDLLGWVKYILKWIDPNQVNCLSGIPTSPVTDYVEATSIGSDKTKMTVVKLSDSKLLVVESHRKSELDDLTPGEEGILVYTVDVNLGSNRSPIKPITNGSPIHKLGNNQLIMGTLQQGESISTDGVKVTLLKQGKSGDFVSIARG